MLSRRALISLLVLVTLSVTLGCAGRSEEAGYQEITVPESPEATDVEETDTADTEGAEPAEAETMAQAGETEAETEPEEPTAEESPDGDMSEEQTARAAPTEKPEPTDQETPEGDMDEEQTTEAEAAPTEEPEPDQTETMAEAEETEAEAEPETEEPTADETTEEVEEPAEAEEPATAKTPTAPTPAERPRPGAIEADEALAIVYPTRGHRMGGWVHFKEVEGGVRVLAKFKGLKPNQKHGFHIHEYGDFGDREAGLTAGGHYDPENTGRHGRPGAEEPHHAGDLGNLEANADGVAGYDRVIKGISVAGGPNPILGRAVVVHTRPDDFGQPDGNAGPRLGVGVIGVANPE